MTPWETRYRVHVDTEGEQWHLKQLAAEMQAEGEEVWVAVFDLADSSCPFERSTFKQVIEEQFLTWQAEDEWDEDANAYEWRTGRDALDLDGNPLADRKHWIRQRAAELSKQVKEEV